MFESDEDATFTLGYVTLQLQGNERKTLFYTILDVAQPVKRRKVTRMIRDATPSFDDKINLLIS